MFSIESVENTTRFIPKYIKFGLNEENTYLIFDSILLTAKKCNIDLFSSCLRSFLKNNNK